MGEQPGPTPEVKKDIDKVVNRTTGVMVLATIATAGAAVSGQLPMSPEAAAAVVGGEVALAAATAVVLRKTMESVDSWKSGRATERIKGAVRSAREGVVNAARSINERLPVLKFERKGDKRAQERWDEKRDELIDQQKKEIEGLKAERDKIKAIALTTYVDSQINDIILTDRSIKRPHNFDANNPDMQRQLYELKQDVFFDLFKKGKFSKNSLNGESILNAASEPNFQNFVIDTAGLQYVKQEVKKAKEGPRGLNRDMAQLWDGLVTKIYQDRKQANQTQKTP